MIKQLIKSIKPLSLAILLGLGASVALKAQDAAEGPSTADLKIAADTLWVLIAGFLVFWMNAGFGCVESGLSRAKNVSKDEPVRALTCKLGRFSNSSMSAQR